MKENNNFFLSIIIPAYNAEPYLRKCVDSCLHQKGNVPEYEIVIVNDGSTDGTQDIIDEYDTKYSIVSYIRQANGGLSKARNEGLKVAKGDYVWFVDSDDWISENALSVIYRIIKSNHPEVITFRGYDWKNGELKLRRSPYITDKGDISGMDVLRKMGTKMWCPCVPFYCMKRQLLTDNDLSLMEGVIHEDSEFTPRMLYYAKHAYVSSEILYYVYQNPESLNRKKNPQKGFHTLKVIESLCSFSDRIESKKDKRTFNNIIATTVNMAMKETKEMKRGFKRLFCKAISNSFLLHMYYTSNIKFKIESILLFFLPYIMITIVAKKTQKEKL